MYRRRKTDSEVNFKLEILNQCCGSALVSKRIRIRIQLFIALRIRIWVRIQKAKPMWILVRLESKKFEFLHEKYTLIR
jgi:hypothetical protein